ncbi:hypothetical protein ACPCSC_10225 [Streptomyces lavendulocolor]|uniref:hypothetical protein n=1 Tax=Streptomyces lavendulocolor TaxID=67316 RepID=UPI003C2F4622
MDGTPQERPGQFLYAHGDLELVLVPGRDTAARFSSSPLTYQKNHEPELAAFRGSSWAVIVIGPEARRDQVQARHAHVLAMYGPTA